MNKQNCKFDILRKKMTLRDTNTTETDKVGLQPWTAVSPFLELVSTVQHIKMTPVQKCERKLIAKLTRTLSVSVVFFFSRKINFFSYVVYQFCLYSSYFFWPIRSLAYPT